MAQALMCPQCRKTVPTDAPQGLCPACLMQAGLQSDSPDGKSVVTASQDKTARIWKVPQLPPGSPEHIVLWSEVRTGLTLDERGDVRVLGAAEWQQRRQRLQKLGGPPEH